MTQPHSTKALDWRNAKLKGQRLSEHELTESVACDLCGEVFASITGLWICIPCTEETLQAGVIQ